MDNLCKASRPIYSDTMVWTKIAKPLPPRSTHNICVCVRVLTCTTFCSPHSIHECVHIFDKIMMTVYKDLQSEYWLNVCVWSFVVSWGNSIDQSRLESRGAASNEQAEPMFSSFCNFVSCYAFTAGWYIYILVLWSMFLALMCFWHLHSGIEEASQHTSTCCSNARDLCRKRTPFNDRGWGRSPAAKKTIGKASGRSDAPFTNFGQ